MLIGFHGKKYSGKDSCYKLIKEANGEKVLRVSFADKLKESAAASLNITVEELEELKSREDLFFELHMPILHGRGKYKIRTYKFNIRQYLQWFGTQGHRNIFGDSFWIVHALPDGFDHAGKIVCVTDVRFIDEAERIKKLKGVIVRVERPGLEQDDSHESETPLPESLVDLVIVNDGDFTDLAKRVNRIISMLSVQRFTLGHY